MPLLEKAFAKLHGCYIALEGGLIDDGLVDMTGLVANKLKVQAETADEEKTEQFWRLLINYRTDKTLMGCSIDAEAMEGDVMDDDRRPTGLITRHAYALLDVMYVPNPQHPKKRNRLMRVRNPWGDKEWKGRWADGSSELMNNIDAVQKQVDKLGEDEIFDPNNDQDGTFLMCYGDWRYYFSNLFACIDFPDMWSGVRFNSTLTI